ncbi:MAG: hypothetical protein GXO77_03665 [Calditrichaeota bacterium]|nr:hypothetical protein [Calditrichota bacterium]
MAEISKDFITHFEFLGYEIEPHEDENTVIARHQRYGTTVVRAYLDGLLFQQYFRLKENVMGNRLAFLEAVNNLNSKAYIVTYVSVGEPKVTLRMDAIYFGPYDKQRFGVFLEAFNFDTYDRVVEHEAMKNFIE